MENGKVLIGKKKVKTFKLVL